MTFNIKVEIAFNAGFRTPAVDRVWTDVTTWTEGDPLSIGYGRADEMAAVDANTLTGLTLDNRDGRFTPDNASSPYYPNVTLGRPIRVTATAGVVTSVRFTGYIDEWTLGWSGGSGTSPVATVTATSRLGRLGLNSPKILVRTAEERVAGASDIWPLNDSSGGDGVPKVAANSATNPAMGNLIPSGLVSLQGTAGPGGSSDLVAGFLGGQLKSAGRAPVAQLDQAMAVGFWIRPALDPIYASQTVRLGSGQDGIAFVLETGLSQTVGLILSNVSYTFWPAYLSPLTIGVGYHFLIKMVRLSPTSWQSTIWRDGVIVAGPTANTYPAGSAPSDFSLTIGDEYFGGAVSDVSVYTGAAAAALDTTTAGYLADPAAAAGYSGQSTSQRIGLLARWANVPAAEQALGTSTVLMDSIKDSGERAAVLMRQAEDTEAGVLYDDRQGRLTLASRSARYNKATDLTIDASLDLLGADLPPRFNRQGLINNVSGKGSDDIEFFYSDEASREEYGDADASVTASAQSPDEALMIAAAMVNSHALPRFGVPSATLNVSDWSGANLTALLGLDIGSLVTVANAPAPMPASTVSFFVEGYTESIDPFKWTITLNLSPSWPNDSVLILDDPVKGVLDQRLLAL
ncbi:hypothetical protein ACIRN4_16370 [Pimelobacter simplex]|uniref:hypothetical protein n=1 Tax=Nocardioides simplex TaxID=2045 RepID=UPI0038177032